MPSDRTAAAEVLSPALLDLFRLTSLLQAVGDRLVAHLGLTSARWQVLGAISAADGPHPVAWLARDLGAHRQNVQRIVNDLQRDGLVAFAANPRHRRAQLVVLTEPGREAFAEAMRLQAPWLNHLTEGLSVEAAQAFGDLVAALRARLQADGP
ncbi:MAG TPA: MarR family winged helix-turn-helix transcriptional regulator [Phenylobacterium sp.]|nr:MarR family winged helix-turn-helix transcriptional regulator [Phenylobacterium sp.]